MNGITTPILHMDSGDLPDGLAQAFWLAFERTTDAEQARRRFVQRFGVPPVYVGEYRGNFLAGPIPRPLIPSDDMGTGEG